jgi:hypothetical protein
MYKMMKNHRKKKRKPFLKPYVLPEGIQGGEQRTTTKGF